MVVTTRRGSVTRLRAGAPGAQQEEQILHANVAAVVEVGGTAFARPPGPQQDEQILNANVAAGVEVPRANTVEEQYPYRAAVTAGVYGRFMPG